MIKDQILDVLDKNTLFKNLSRERIEYLLSLCNYRLETLCKDSIVYDEDEVCGHMGFVLDGRVNISKLNLDGSSMTIKTMTRGDFFGDALLFSSHQSCHSTIITSTKSKILFVSSSDLLNICEIDEIFLKNFLRSLSDRIAMLNKKIKILSFSSVRQRISCFLLEQYKIQNSKKIILNLTREELGELLGVARPSISRELSNMEKDNLISVKGKEISIIDLESIRDIL